MFWKNFVGNGYENLGIEMQIYFLRKDLGSLGNDDGDVKDGG